MHVNSDETEKINKLPNISKFTRFNTYEKFDCLAFKNPTLTSEKPTYLGFCGLEISELHIDNTYYNVLKPKLEKLELHYMDCDSIFLSFEENFPKDSNNLKDYFALSNLEKYHELISNVNERFNGKMKNETPKSLWIKNSSNFWAKS